MLWPPSAPSTYDAESTTSRGPASWGTRTTTSPPTDCPPSPPPHPPHRQRGEELLLRRTDEHASRWPTRPTRISSNQGLAARNAGSLGVVQGAGPAPGGPQRPSSSHLHPEHPGACRTSCSASTTTASSTRPLRGLVLPARATSSLEHIERGNRCPIHPSSSSATAIRTTSSPLSACQERLDAPTPSSPTS